MTASVRGCLATMEDDGGLSQRIAELKLQERGSYSEAMFRARKAIYERVLSQTQTEPEVV